MIRVLPYIETLGSEKFKKFLLTPFKVCLVAEEIKDAEINYEVIFDGWYGKNMGEWYRLRNDDGIILEFYSTHYEIKKKSGLSYKFPFPDTINDFINDMCRLNIGLHWSIWIDEKFEPKDYLNKKGVEDYYRALLSKMDKSHELSQNL